MRQWLTRIPIQRSWSSIVERGTVPRCVPRQISTNFDNRLDLMATSARSFSSSRRSRLRILRDGEPGKNAVSGRSAQAFLRPLPAYPARNQGEFGPDGDGALALEAILRVPEQVAIRHRQNGQTPPDNGIMPKLETLDMSDRSARGMNGPHTVSSRTPGSRAALRSRVTSSAAPARRAAAAIIRSAKPKLSLR